MTETRHGHHIIGSPVLPGEGEGGTKDCGGPARCLDCVIDLQGYWSNLQHKNHFYEIFEDLVAKERERQKKKGYTIEHDQQSGIVHLLSEIRRRVRDDKPRKQIAAMVDAAIELLTYPEPPKDDEAAVKMMDVNSIHPARWEYDGKNWFKIVKIEDDDAAMRSMKKMLINASYGEAIKSDEEEPQETTDDNNPIFITPEDSEQKSRAGESSLPEYVRLEDILEDLHKVEERILPGTQEERFEIYDKMFRDAVSFVSQGESAEPNKRAQILREAEEHINGDRAQSYGDPAISFGRICDLWHSIGFHKWNAEKEEWEDITPVDVALALLLLKVSRIVGQPDHEDSWVDAAGYSGLGGELANRKEDE